MQPEELYGSGLPLPSRTACPFFRLYKIQILSPATCAFYRGNTFTFPPYPPDKRKGRNQNPPSKQPLSLYSSSPLDQAQPTFGLRHALPPCPWATGSALSGTSVGFPASFSLRLGGR